MTNEGFSQRLSNLFSASNFQERHMTDLSTIPLLKQLDDAHLPIFARARLALNGSLLT